MSRQCQRVSHSISRLVSSRAPLDFAREIEESCQALAPAVSGTVTDLFESG